jgi:hypothetical protein
MSDWSDEETDDPIHADRRNFYKVEKWSRDGHRIAEMVFAGSSLDKACRIFERMTKHRPRIRLTIRQRTRVLQHHPPQWNRLGREGPKCSIEPQMKVSASPHFI